MLSIHLGAHKTASTHLQYSLRLVREDLRAGGVLYLDPSMLRDEQVPLQRALNAGPGGEADEVCTHGLMELMQDCPHLLLSEENILGGTHRTNLYSGRGLVYPYAARRLRQVIAIAGGGPVTLYLGLRDPAGFNVSAFALQVSLGNEIGLADYLSGRDPTKVGWNWLVKRLIAIEEVARIVIWRYEDYAQLRPQILADMLPGGLEAIVPEPAPSNESLTQAGYDWFLRHATANPETDLPRLAKRARARFGRSAGHAALRLLSEEDYARSALNYAEDLARLCLLPKVDFLLP